MKDKKIISVLLIFASAFLFSGCAENLGQTLGEAGINTLMGMGVVFVVLILISFIISAFNLINKAEQKMKKKAEPAPAAPAAPAAAEVIPEEEQEDDTELIAVIAAAIAAYEGTSPDGVVVRSIRKVSAAKNWKRG